MTDIREQIEQILTAEFSFDNPTTVDQLLQLFETEYQRRVEDAKKTR